MDSIMNNYGGRRCFFGEIVTIKCFEDNAKVKELANQDGRGNVMVVDGGGSLRKALFCFLYLNRHSRLFGIALISGKLAAVRRYMDSC